jgi:hypothetical protein
VEQPRGSDSDPWHKTSTRGRSYVHGASARMGYGCNDCARGGASACTLRTGAASIASKITAAGPEAAVEQMSVIEKRQK